VCPAAPVCASVLAVLGRILGLTLPLASLVPILVARLIARRVVSLGRVGHGQGGAGLGYGLLGELLRLRHLALLLDGLPQEAQYLVELGIGHGDDPLVLAGLDLGQDVVEGFNRHHRCGRRPSYATIATRSSGYAYELPLPTLPGRAPCRGHVTASITPPEGGYIIRY